MMDLSGQSYILFVYSLKDEGGTSAREVSNAPLSGVRRVIAGKCAYGRRKRTAFPRMDVVSPVTAIRKVVQHRPARRAY